MELFPDVVPRRGAQPRVRFRVLTAQFGDGYSQRGADGLNAREEQWPLEFALPHAQIAQVQDFLERHAGVKAFLWAPPGAIAAPFLCDGYSGPVRLGKTHARLQATFTRVYDL